MNDIKQENENLISGSPVKVSNLDNHYEHINDHKELLSDIKYRQDVGIVRRTLDHIQEHIDKLKD